MQISAVILAAGKGTRLRSVVSDRPKPLALVNGRPFITYIFDQLIEAGFKEVVVCVSHMYEKFFEVAIFRYKSLLIGYSHEPEPRGTGTTLKNALPYLSGEYVLVLNGDTYVDIDLRRYIEDFKESRKVSSIVLYQDIPAGIYIIKKEFIPAITTEEPFHTYRGKFLDIGTPETYAKAQGRFRRNFGVYGRDSCGDPKDRKEAGQ